MAWRLFAILSIGLLLCTSCAQTQADATVADPSDLEEDLFESVSRNVYPLDQTVFGDVYEPASETHTLVPRLPGQPAPEQEKPPLIHNN